MSIKSFFEKVGDELKKLFGSTNWEKQTQAVITYVAPVLDTILTFADPSIEPIVSGVIAKVQADLAAVSAAVSGAAVPAGSTASAAVQAAMGSVKTNLTSLLSVAEVKNSAKVTQITAAVNTIVSEIDACLTYLPSAVSSSSSGSAAPSTGATS